jgi:hypothetical protein
MKRPTAKLPRRKPNDEIMMTKDTSPTVAPTRSYKKGGYKISVGAME